MKLVLTLAEIRMRKERFARRAAEGRRLARVRMRQNRDSAMADLDHWRRVWKRKGAISG